MAAPEARPFPRPRPIASFIQRMDVDDAFEVPAEYRPPPLPTLWDWIEGPLRRAEYERQYPTQVATITDVPVPVPQQGVLVPGPVPQQGVLVPAPVDIGALLKAKKWSKELSAALKEKYGDILGGEMARQMRIKPTTSEQELKKRAEEKVGQRESEVWLTSNSSRSLNAKGKKISGLTKGTGQGFRAGDPTRWHVHYDHVKWGTSANTRINFPGRRKQDILSAFISDSPQPVATSADRQSWDACYQWMQNNL